MRPDVSHIGLAVDTGDGGSCRCCSSSICFTGSVLTTCLPRVCFIATAIRRSLSSCLIYFYVYVYVCCLHWRINVFNILATSQIHNISTARLALIHSLTDATRPTEDHISCIMPCTTVTFYHCF